MLAQWDQLEKGVAARGCRRRNEREARRTSEACEDALDRFRGMSPPAIRGRLQWSVVVPILALLVLGVALRKHDHWSILTVVGVALIGAVVGAVHHAEVVAHKVGEPFGSLILAVAVTVIEVG